MRLLRYLLNIGIVSFWIVMMGLLVAKEFLPTTISPLEIRFPEKLPFTENWAIYSDQEKIGYSETKLYEEPSGGYIWKGITKLKMPFAPLEVWPQERGVEEEVPVSIESSVEFETTAKLKGFDVKMDLYDLEIDIEGEVVNNELELVTKTDSSEVKYTLPWAGDSDIINNGLLPWFYKSRLRPGDRFQWKVFNPLTRRNELVKAVVQRSTMHYHQGDFVTASVVAVWYQNAKTEFWIDENGNPIKVHTPWGWKLIAE